MKATFNLKAQTGLTEAKPWNEAKDSIVADVKEESFIFNS